MVEKGVELVEFGVQEGFLLFDFDEDLFWYVFFLCFVEIVMVVGMIFDECVFLGVQQVDGFVVFEVVCFGECDLEVGGVVDVWQFVLYLGDYGVVFCVG